MKAKEKVVALDSARRILSIAATLRDSYENWTPEYKVYARAVQLLGKLYANVEKEVPDA